MKVASSQLNFSSDHYQRTLRAHNTALQGQTSTSATVGSSNLRNTQRSTIDVMEQVSLNSSQRYQTNTQSYVQDLSNPNNDLRFSNEKIIESTLNKTFIQRTQIAITQSTILQANPTVAQRGATGLDTVATQAEITFGEQTIFQQEEQTNFSINGEVTTEDGRKISFTLSAQLDRNISIEKNSGVFLQNINKTDPLAINLEGGIVTLRDTAFLFDVDADGKKENLSFVSKGSGFIVYDKNEDNKINDGNEMFGTQSGNGFEDLRQYDDDNNGVIDENDRIYEKLSLWTKDGAGNDHLTSLKDAGVGAIGLEYEDTRFELKDHYNNSLGSIQRSGYFLMEDGRAGFAQQVDLSERNLEAEEKNKAEFEPNIATLELAAVGLNHVEFKLPFSHELGSPYKTDSKLTLEQAKVLTTQNNETLLAKYDEVSSVEQTEETKSLLEKLVDKLEEYGNQQREKQQTKDDKT